MKRLLVTIISFLILSSATTNVAENVFNNKSEELQHKYDTSYQQIYSIVTGDEFNYMITSYESANKIWKDLSGVDFDICFDKAFQEISGDISDAYSTFGEYSDFQINEEG